MLSNRFITSIVSRIAFSGFLRSMPTFFASGSHHAPMPQMMRFGARSSSVKKVAASNPILRVQLLITPLPIFMREVTAANAAMGTIASRTRRDSACHTASKPRCSAYCAYAMPSRISCLSCRYIATRAICFSLLTIGCQPGLILPHQQRNHEETRAGASPGGWPSFFARDARATARVARTILRSGWRTPCIVRATLAVALANAHSMQKPDTYPALENTNTQIKGLDEYGILTYAVWC